MVDTGGNTYGDRLAHSVKALPRANSKGRKVTATKRYHVALILVNTLEEFLGRFGETLMGMNVGAGDSTVMSR